MVSFTMINIQLPAEGIPIGKKKNNKIDFSHFNSLFQINVYPLTMATFREEIEDILVQLQCEIINFHNLHYCLDIIIEKYERASVLSNVTKNIIVDPSLLGFSLNISYFGGNYIQYYIRL